MSSETDPERERLSGFMDRLSAGLESIHGDYGRFVHLVDEDPETFGGGHFVFYRPDNEARFAIEKQYTDTDWSDPDRLPISWSWRAEELGSRPDGSGVWEVRDQGRVQAAEVDTLISKARAWASSVRAQTLRAQSFAATGRAGPDPHPPGHRL